MKAAAQIIGAALVVASFFAMYFFADAACIPDRHTSGFCGQWIAMGMVFPAIFWGFIALIVMVWRGL